MTTALPLRERGDWMQTFTGRKFYPMDPQPEDIDPLDIAHALSMVCRYGGHVNRFYSVAEHSVLLSHVVTPENALWALLHDAAEAYMGDMVRALKQEMPQYRLAENGVMFAIVKRFGLASDPIWMPAEIKEADHRILLDERNALMTPSGHPWFVDQKEPLGVPIHAWSPPIAERMFMARLLELWSDD